MRKIIAIHHITLDGVVQAPGGPEEDRGNKFPYGGWAMLPEFDDDETGKAVTNLISGKYDILLGRKTYDIFAGYWPYHGDNPIGKSFNKAKKCVATRKKKKLAWENSHRIGDDVVKEIRKLKSKKGPPIHVWGSSNLLQTLIAADLVDEFRFWIFPVILGQGKRLFENGVPPRKFKLVESNAASKGVVLTTYRLAGVLKTP